MRIGKGINGPVQGNAFLNKEWKIKLFFPFDIITDHVACQYIRLVKGKICMGQVIHNSVNKDNQFTKACLFLLSNAGD